MKAYVIEEFGPPSVFQKRDIPKPAVTQGHVLIKVKATSVNPVDCKIRKGAVPAMAPPFPAVLHSDVAGIIEEVGAGVSEFKKGDEVFGCAGGVKGLGGALAEYMLADAHLIAKKPRSLTMRNAAAFPLVTITAWTALFNKAHLQAKQTILIHGGAGGVGHIAVQLAKWAEAKVFATVSSEDQFELVRELGADEPINFKAETPEHYVKRLTQGKGFEVIFDTVGDKNLENSFQAASLNGVVSTTVSRTTLDLSAMHQKGLSLHVVFMLIPLLFNIGRKGHGEILSKTAKLIDEGKLKALIDPNTFTFDEVAKAHELVESGKSFGKVVLEQP